MSHLQFLRRFALLALLFSFFASGCSDSTSQSRDAATADASAARDTESFDTTMPVDASSGNADMGQPDAATVGPLDIGAGPDVEQSPDGSTSTPPDAGLDAGGQAPPPATIIVLPDTQYYASSYPSVFNGQTAWIVAQQSVLNIAAVLHVGDIVDSDLTVQWTVANPAMRQLDNVVPYDVVPGNHDYSTANRGSMIDNYFAPASMPWITGTMKPGQIENNYALIDIGPKRWLILGLEFGPRDAVLTWADSVLKTYANYPAILLTHAYLYADGTRYDINVGGTDSNASNYQYWSPWYYGFTASEGINDGEAMWQKLVLPNSNVRLVFCGHQTGWARLTSTRPDGTTVHQMLSDYQWLQGENFGFGYLRVVQLDYGKKTIQVQTYSPYLNAYIDDDPNQFTLDLNL